MTTAKVFWDPEHCSNVLPLTLAPQARPLTLPFKTAVSKTILLAAEGHHVLFREGSRHLQLLIRPEPRLDARALLTDAVIGKRDIMPRLRSLACLNDLLSSGRLLPRYFLPEPRGRRLTAVLRALDGALQRASHRDIAIAVYGRKRIDADWADPGEHLRDAVRRAIVRGRALMHGDYRSFLR